jgi:hypothetical protein
LHLKCDLLVSSNFAFSKVYNLYRYTLGAAVRVVTHSDLVRFFAMFAPAEEGEGKEEKEEEEEKEEGNGKVEVEEEEEEEKA